MARRTIVVVEDETAIARSPAARLRNEGFDVAVAHDDYLAGLSADAVPELTRLPARERECALRPQRSRLAGGDSWAEANVARARARASLPAPSRAQC